MTERMSLTNIAELAGVNRAAVTNWLRRHPDFPGSVEPVEGEPEYDADEVAGWLDERKIPRNSLRDGEVHGTTFGHRFRGNSIGVTVEPGLAPDREAATMPVQLEQRLRRAMDALRGQVDLVTVRALTLALVYLRADEASWLLMRQLVSADDPFALLDGLPAIAERHRHFLPELARMLTLPAASRAAGPPVLELTRTIDQAAEVMPGHELFDFLLQRFSSFDSLRGSEFLTPESVVRVMVGLVDPQRGERVHDPCCGAGTLLTGVIERQRTPDRSVEVSVSGTALSEYSWLLARMNLSVHNVEVAAITRGNPLADGTDRGPRYDVVVSNPPFGMHHGISGGQPGQSWPFGAQPTGSGDFAWLQHAVRKLEENGRAAILMPHGPAFHGGQAKRIREQMVRAGVVRAIVGLPAGLFSATGIAVCVWLLGPPVQDRGVVLFVDARGESEAVDRASRVVPAAGIERILDVHRRFLIGEAVDERGFCHVAAVEAVERNDFVLTPQAYVGIVAAHGAENTARDQIAAAEARLGKLADQLREVDELVRERLGRIGW
ncbi:HsdM family class I SAM-dependent methyltransferase [Amycolatopsis sp. H20-H5]|uniref:HsdM family class I SAM-dependent methyltransferase n=1 Tax=Amycolatopsis sp. H20-H5 TaxID=3046309 RepID=UPI002DBEC542|nr:N-6 DNA methylase [Amycolatopsis sp. H20-H5]MEC3973836.1 N-6 DNA methylase [Amycolatopsis sp. H20-H5]